MTKELIEVRGPTNQVIPDDLWLLVIDGDVSKYGKGDSRSALMDPDATVLTIELTGNDVMGGSSSNVSSQTPNIEYNDNFSGASGFYMLIRVTDPDGVAIEGPEREEGLVFDGNIDATGNHTSWILYNSVAYLDDDVTMNFQSEGMHKWFCTRYGL
ncbi:MAG: hypothetical protein ABJQ39_14515 [Winogradskyella arenosi]